MPSDLYPNTPTANLFDDATIDRIVAAVGAQRGLVVFDEAYQPFSSRTWMQRMAPHEHVLVLRTLSKFGLAGVRLGYLRGGLRDPQTLCAVLDFLCGHEADLVAAAHDLGVAPQDLARARDRLE